MPFRVTDSSVSARLAAQIGVARQRNLRAQEQVSSGRRINRPSDDPSGAADVIRLRTSQAAVDQFRRTATAANDVLLLSDNTLDSYQVSLDRVRTLMTQGASDITTPEERQLIAVEIESLRTQMLAIANSQRDGRYLFGGTRQDAPPFDPTTGAPSAVPATDQLMQLEPDAAPTPISVTAETVFADTSGTIFDELSNVAAALRGTGDPVADRATVLNGMQRLDTFITQASVARTRIGSSINIAQAATSRLEQTSLSLESSAQQIEAADFVEAAVQLTESARALDAVIQSAGYLNRRSLLDILG